MSVPKTAETLDYVIIGSGFGGSVSAMRLTEKGYTVLVLERGKRFQDHDFAKTNWNIAKYLWAPAFRCFGILEISLFRDMVVLHGNGVGGGSLGYANVLMKPTDEMFANPSWKHLADWKSLLLPHYETAKRMLGVVQNPHLWSADHHLRDISAELGTLPTFSPTQVGIFFGESDAEGNEVPDPYFGGEGPNRNGCIHCGGCMVGCRNNAKNTMVKNYLYLAEKWGAEVWSEVEARDIKPLPVGQTDGARYEVIYRSQTAWWGKPEYKVRARNVILSAGALGTQRLLFRCRDETKSLAKISACLGTMVRTNSEALLGASARNEQTDYSKGIAITSIFYADPVTTVEPVRYPVGSSLMRFLAGPLIHSSGGFLTRLVKSSAKMISRPLQLFTTYLQPGWAQRTTILLVMQTEDNRIKIRLGRHFLTLGRLGLVSETDKDNKIPGSIPIGHTVARRFAKRIKGIPAGSINEALFDVPMTAHILGGCPFGLSDQDGVIGLDCQIHNYPGLYVVDGSIMPANPGVNPSLSITALAEYAMSLVPAKPGQRLRSPLSSA